jgi:hypothetical protein
MQGPRAARHQLRRGWRLVTDREDDHCAHWHHEGPLLSRGGRGIIVRCGSGRTLAPKSDNVATRPPPDPTNGSNTRGTVTRAFSLDYNVAAVWAAQPLAPNLTRSSRACAW